MDIYNNIYGKWYDKMQVYLCEDIKEHVVSIEKLLMECAKENNIHIEIRSFENAQKLLDDLRKKKETGEIMPNLLFSDIELPGVNGVELGKILKEDMPEIRLVFLTAFEQYAIEGYETGAYRYLLKPPSKEEISKILIDTEEVRKRNKYIIVKNVKEEICLPVNDIFYISAEDKYLVVHTKTKKHLNRGSLQDYETMLEDYGFFRVHRKYLINLRYHKSISNGSIILSNGDKIPLSRRKESAFRSAFMKYIEGGLLQ